MARERFFNTVTKTNSDVLRAKREETEDEAITRLKKMGWMIDDYKFNEKTHLFTKKN